MNKAYLGDSVYVRSDGGMRIMLTTENGLPDDPSNSIVLEPEVIENLLLYLNADKARRIRNATSSPTQAENSRDDGRDRD